MASFVCFRVVSSMVLRVTGMIQSSCDHTTPLRFVAYELGS